MTYFQECSTCKPFWLSIPQAPISQSNNIMCSLFSLPSCSHTNTQHTHTHTAHTHTHTAHTHTHTAQSIIWTLITNLGIFQLCNVIDLIWWKAFKFACQTNPLIKGCLKTMKFGNVSVYIINYFYKQLGKCSMDDQGNSRHMWVIWWWWWWWWYKKDAKILM